MPRLEAARMTRAGAWTCGAILAAYFALCLSQLDHGIASLDAHGIIRVVQTLVDNHKIDISRPPGHPTTEFYLFGTTAWLLHLLGHAFSERVYLLGQALISVASLALFYELLRKLTVRPFQACLGVLALAFSAQFFANAIDGEEFNYALFFVLVAVRLLLAQPPRLYLSIFAFALATGCRPEIVFAGVIYPTYFACARLGRRCVAFAIASIVGAIAIVWLPVFVSSVHAPYDARMNFKQALLVGGYKLVFQSFGIAVFILLLLVLARVCGQLRLRWRAEFPQNFIGVLACVLPLLFFVLFFRYATKPAYVLIALPFLLIAAAESPAILLSIAAFTLLDFVVKIDIFQDRQLTSPFLTRGSSVTAIRQKPFYRLAYLRGAVAECGDGPALVIADAAPWDFEYQIARGTFPAEEKRDTMQQIPAFIPNATSRCVIVPRDAAFANDVIENWRARGYKVKMDANLYRTAFGRYEINRPNESPKFELFSVK